MHFWEKHLQLIIFLNSLKLCMIVRNSVPNVVLFVWFILIGLLHLLKCLCNQQIGDQCFYVLSLSHKKYGMIDIWRIPILLSFIHFSLLRRLISLSKSSSNSSNTTSQWNQICTQSIILSSVHFSKITKKNFQWNPLIKKMLNNWKLEVNRIKINL